LSNRASQQFAIGTGGDDGLDVRHVLCSALRAVS
jgi:hypothetical protein